MHGGQISRANTQREDIRRHLDALLGDDAVLFVPSAPGPAPFLKTPQEELNQFRMRLLALTSIAGMCGLPQARACSSFASSKERLSLGLASQTGCNDLCDACSVRLRISGLCCMSAVKAFSRSCFFLTRTMFI